MKQGRGTQLDYSNTTIEPMAMNLVKLMTVAVHLQEMESLAGKVCFECFRDIRLDPTCPDCLSNGTRGASDSVG